MTTDSTSPSTSAPRVRFAPSPTGYLHVGGVRTALYNWLFARATGGTFVLRIEDTDTARSEDGYTQVILDALRWLGLDWDEGPSEDGASRGEVGPYFQSQRSELYRAHAMRLIEEGKAYYCYRTAEELDALKDAEVAAGRPPRHQRSWSDVTPEQREAYEREGRKPSVRFMMDDSEAIVVNDIVRERAEFPAGTYGDFIILRSDGGVSFHLANVVDDALMGITHVVRAEDHFSNTARHVALYKALGFAVPTFAHLSMILGPDKSKLSKRHGAVSVEWFRQNGYYAEALLNYLALLGWSPPDGNEIMSVADLVKSFELERVTKSAAIFDYGKLNFLNGLRVRERPLDEVAELARAHFLGGEFAGDSAVAANVLGAATYRAVVDLVRGSCDTLAQIPEKARPLLERPTAQVERAAAVREALAATPDARVVLEAFRDALAEMPEAPAREEMSAVFKALQKQTGQKGRGLFAPIRLALTGDEHGPELAGIVPALGRDEAAARVAESLALLA